MDFTHVHSLEKVNYVSVIAHFGGSPQEKQLMILMFFFKKKLILGQIKILKADNVPAYSEKLFKKYFQYYAVTYITAIPYNPQG